MKERLRSSNICLYEENRENGLEVIFEEKKHKNILELIKGLNPQIQPTKPAQSKINKTRFIHRSIIVRKKISKATGDKRNNK